MIARRCDTAAGHREYVGDDDGGCEEAVARNPAASASRMSE
jgi:hypothetical protein